MSKGTAIVTGSAQGIGRSIAIRLARDGFAVVINDLASNQVLIDTTVEEIKASGHKALGVVADVTVRAEVQYLVDTSTETLGPLRVMVANAGIGQADAILDMSETQVAKILDVNVKVVFNCYVVAGKKMLDQGKGGKILGATSVAAFKPFASIAAYAASKWAIRGLTQCFALELGELCTGPEKITVNCYAPGIVGTRMWEASVQSHPTGHQEMLKSLQLLEGRLTHLHGPQDGGHIKTVAESATTLRRVSVPEDVANVVSFLSGSDSDFVTGQALVVDGGICFH